MEAALDVVSVVVLINLAMDVIGVLTMIVLLVCDGLEWMRGMEDKVFASQIVGIVVNLFAVIVLAFIYDTH